MRRSGAPPRRLASPRRPIARMTDIPLLTTTLDSYCKTLLGQSTIHLCSGSGAEGSREGLTETGGSDARPFLLAGVERRLVTIRFDEAWMPKPERLPPRRTAPIAARTLLSPDHYAQTKLGLFFARPAPLEPPPPASPPRNTYAMSANRG